MTVHEVRALISARLRKIRASQRETIGILPGMTKAEADEAHDAHWAAARWDDYALDDFSDGEIEALSWVLQRIRAGTRRRPRRT